MGVFVFHSENCLLRPTEPSGYVVCCAFSLQPLDLAGHPIHIHDAVSPAPPFNFPDAYPGVSVAAVGYVVSFCHFVSHPFRRLTLLPPKARRSGSGRRRLSPLCPSSGAPVAEGRVAGEVAGQEAPRGGEFLSDEAQPHQPGAHRKLGVLGLLGLGACSPNFLRHLVQRETKLNVALQLAGVIQISE